MNQIICRSCHVSKDREKDFYSSNKYTCKKCYIKHYSDQARTPEYRIRQKEQRIRHKEYRVNFYYDWYHKNGRKRAKDYREVIIEWRKNNPEKVRAHEAIRRAIRTGKLIKPKSCSECGKEKRLHGHHFDYSKPLEVIWLCASCHKNLHLKLKDSNMPL